RSPPPPHSRTTPPSPRCPASRRSTPCPPAGMWTASPPWSSASRRASVGACLYIKRKALERLGLFDEASFGLGYGEESAFCFRALEAGFLNVLDDATFIYHAGQRSFG